MENLLLLIGCLLGGLLLRRAGRVPEQAHAALNAVVVHVALPAVTLRSLHAFRFDTTQIWPVAMPWLLFGVGAGVFWAIGRCWRLPRASVGALTLVGGLGNTSFVGLPMIEALRGRDGMGLGLLIDQLGSYLALSTVGLLAATLYAGQAAPTWRSMARRVATFPPLIALVAALLLRPVPFAPLFDALLARLGDLLAPLALLSVGMQLRLSALRGNARLLGVGLAFKLVACPALVALVLWTQSRGGGLSGHVSLIEAAMPPMIGAGIVASQFELDAPLVALMVGVGIPLGLLTAPAWYGLLSRLAATS